jgi:glucose/arabinose dehydrogenase
MLHRWLAVTAVVVASCKSAPKASVAVGSSAPQVSIDAAIDAPSISPPSISVELSPVPADVAKTVKLRKVVDGLSRPVLLTFAPGDPRKRLFIVEQSGKIRSLENGTLTKQALLDVSKEISDGNEQGLLGLAFHPDFARNRKLYIYLTDQRGNSHVVEYVVDSKHPDVVDVSTRRDVLTVKQPYSNHNGGHLLFGPAHGANERPDRKLYIGFGDGGSGGDPHRNGQNPTVLLGKLVRIDVDAAHSDAEIVHLGLRNPWRFTFDASNDNLIIGDVGQNLWEQVYAVAGSDDRQHNFGWNVVEGNHCFEAKTCDRSKFTPPITDYSHDEGCSVTGGVVYRGKALPALVGQYFYADFCTSLLRSLAWQANVKPAALGSATGAVISHWNWRKAIDAKQQLAQISSFGTDEQGEIYIVSLTGTIWQLVPQSP